MRIYLIDRNNNVVGIHGKRTPRKIKKLAKKEGRYQLRATIEGLNISRFYEQEHLI